MALSLATFRSRVKIRYGRSSASTDSQDALINQCVNYALREVYNALHDNAWFLRKTGSVTINGMTAVTTLPANMKRLYRLEDESNDPGRDIPWALVRYDNDDLSLVIIAQVSGTVTAHYLDIPIDLVSDTDTAVLPDEHAELVVLLAAQRIAESVANITFTKTLLQDLQRLWSNIKRDSLRYETMRQEGLRSSFYRAHPSFP